jgi:large subunit ribosomal protein L9
MDIILIQDVDNLGAANEVVKVRNGYARNFLIPRKFAVEASPSNLKQLEEKRKQIEKKEKQMLSAINDVIAKLKEGALKIGAKSGTSGKIFGTVTSLQLSRAIREQNLQVAAGIIGQPPVKPAARERRQAGLPIDAFRSLGHRPTALPVSRSEELGSWTSHRTQHQSRPLQPCVASLLLGRFCAIVAAGPASGLSLDVLDYHGSFHRTPWCR